MKKILLLAIAIVLITGCGIHQSVQVPISNSPEVILDENNFRVVGMAKATSQYDYILGIGSVNRKDIKKHALSDMMQNAKLKGSQTIINITEKVSKTGFYPFYTRFTITVTGTIVEFIDKISKNIPATLNTETVSTIPTSKTTPIPHYVVKTNNISEKEIAVVLNKIIDILNSNETFTTEQILTVQKELENLHKKYQHSLTFFDPELESHIKLTQTKANKIVQK